MSMKQMQLDIDYVKNDVHDEYAFVGRKMEGQKGKRMKKQYISRDRDRDETINKEGIYGIIGLDNNETY